jgi:uncharacterized membrane protein YtjA (UPF0391 family)
MFGGAVAFLVVALIAALLGHSGVAELSINIAWIFLLFGAVFAALFSRQESAGKGGQARESGTLNEVD